MCAVRDPRERSCQNSEFEGAGRQIAREVGCLSNPLKVSFEETLSFLLEGPSENSFPT